MTDIHMPIWTVTPFLGLLVAIAVMPLLAGRWWHDNWHKAAVSIAFGLPTAVYVAARDPGILGHTFLEYVAFICLLGSLFVISGGVRVSGSLAGTPLANTGMLAFGALLANVVGTTGAAMLLIRPFLRANRARASRVHLVVFFIFIVANCGGCLTPLGDPPLFLGFLKGVPFHWTLGLWKEWAAVVGALLVVFNLYDQYRFHREDLVSREDLDVVVERHETVRLEGKRNLILLGGVIAVVLLSGAWIHPRYGEVTSQLVQSASMVALATVSLRWTSRKLREENEFSWHPFVEVAVLFAGIFAAMAPALTVVRERGASLGISEPWQYFWVTGSLSALLDNAPTYLTSLSMAQYLPDEVAGTTHRVLSAISCGAVFFGAATYIGNGPNFMVRAIAEHSGIRMPSFFGYLAWSAAVLLPILAIATFLFFI